MIELLSLHRRWECHAIFITWKTLPERLPTTYECSSHPFLDLVLELKSHPSITRLGGRYLRHLGLKQPVYWIFYSKMWTAHFKHTFNSTIGSQVSSPQQLTVLTWLIKYIHRTQVKVLFRLLTTFNDALTHNGFSARYGTQILTNTIISTCLAAARQYHNWSR